MSVDLEHTATQAADVAPERGAELPGGARLDHFRVDKKLGAGGMGEVYLATDLALDRPVAIKMLPQASTSGAARERLVREARAQARIHHANVAHIYFIGEDAGRLYFAMEHLAGGTLADAIAAGPMPVEKALDAIRAAALGLREAQRAGFTHRDVKPSNLMMDAHGVVKVVDFGLVAAAPEPASGGAVAQTTLAGTPLYMAPEQARGEPIDHRADIYALGATLYHLVSGKPPFRADSADELATLHRSAARPSVPRGANPRTAIVAIDAVVAKMMAPDPRDRFASYDELLRALELASAAYTRPAGVMVRAIAWSVDLFLVMFAFVLVMVVLDLAAGARIDVNGSRSLPLVALVQAACIARWGTTPGKALFELEVIEVATGARPRWQIAFARQLVLYAPTLVALVGDLTLPLLDAWGWIETAIDITATTLPLLALAHAALRVPGKRAPWDRIAGTIVRYRALRG